MGLFSPGGLILANAAVNVYAYTITQGADGGTVETYGDIVALDVPCLITQFAGDRDGTFGTDAQRDRGTLSGTDASLNRTDVRFVVTTAPPDRPEMEGWYLRVTSPVGHPRRQYGIVGSRVTIKWERLDLPIDEE